jgi:adenosylhomocysteine nucleosidase
VSTREHDGRRFKFFENDRAVVVCGGVGAEAGRRAAEAVVSLYAPESIVSVGFAGGLESKVKVGDLIVPRTIIDACDGSRTDAPVGKTTLVSFGGVANPDQKARLAKSYGAQAVDMEAAAVARSAAIHGVPFMAVKAISDEMYANLPPVQDFVSASGRFRTAAFLAYLSVRPWWWAGAFRLAKNSSRATSSLCRWLNQYNEPEFLKNKPADLHQITKAPS